MLFKNLQREGYVGVYDSVQRFVKQWKSQDRGSQGAFVPLVFSPGDACQFDWSKRVMLGGISQVVNVRTAPPRSSISQ